MIQIFFFFLCLCSAAAIASVVPQVTDNLEFTVHLKDPVFSRGILSTDKGGVVTGENLRVQAQKMEYVNRVENGHLVQKIFAEGDLLFEYGGRVFVGKRLEFNFTTKTGTLWEGRTYFDLWYVGGEKIALESDGSFYIYGASITTCESKDNSWEIKAGMVKITKDHLLSAKNIRFRFFKLPVLWLPALKSNLKFVKDTPIKYKLTWDKSLGPRATMRYRIFSWEQLSLFFRLDYRLKRGFGAAVESDFLSLDKRTRFVTKSYGANDKTVPEERGPKRYRLQGLFHTISKDEKTEVHLTYDKISDDKMPSDFKSDDFEVDTSKRTILLVTHEARNIFSSLSFQPRLNRFQSLDQELPLITAGIRPFNIGRSGIIMQNFASAGFLDYVYATDLTKVLHSTHAIRLETRNQIYRPSTFGPVNWTPHLGIVGIFYNNNPERHSIGQGLLTYGCDTNTHLYRTFKHFDHTIEPYLNFQGYSTPTAPTNKHYVFSIADGYEYLNLLKMGVRNLFFPKRLSCFNPSFIGELFSWGFLSENKSLHEVFPRLYGKLGWYRPWFMIDGTLGWNNRERVWDYTNVRTSWTVNENIAFGIEFRHRSKFEWRKADKDNFFVDAARSLDDLLASPLSDGRNTLLTRLQLRFTPTLTCHVESHHGWGRRNEPRYNEAKISFFKVLAGKWQLRVSYEHSPDDDRFTYGVSLID